ncbi:MAG: hypothetical protein V3R24_01005 [Gemmatimonadales bacterium]
MFLAIALIACGWWFFQSPLPGAIAVSLKEKHGHHASAEITDAVDMLTDEVAALREEVTEIGERLEFTERVMARLRRDDALPAGREGL